MDMDQRKLKINCNLILIACNILIWLLMSLSGDTRSAYFMMEHGAMVPEYVLGGEWYRLFTAIFLHFGAEHLICNMFMQYFLGDMLLRAVSQWRFTVIYLFAGLSGSVTSLTHMLWSGDYAVSAGASGAIYGLIGALLWVVLRNRGSFEGISLPRMLLACVVYISYGFTDGSVDAWAHLGGAVGGLVLCAILYRRQS